MDLQNNILEAFNLVDDVKAYTLQTYQKALCLSEELNEYEAKSPYKPPFSLNFLDRNNCDEPTTSWIIRHIFAYSYYDANSDKVRHPFFESFAKTFLTDIGFNMDWIDAPQIIKEHEYEHIDVLVRDKRYAIIIENKLKGADFQLNQLARYIATMRNEHYSEEQIFVVVLPKDQIENDDLQPSVWKLPQDGESLKERFRERTLFIHEELSEWLYDCVVNNAAHIPKEELRRQYVLTSAILQFVDYLNGLYKTRENNKFDMDIQNFLSDKLELKGHTTLEQLKLVDNKKNDVDELSKQLTSLLKKKIKEYRHEIVAKYGASYTDDIYFDANITIKGIPLIVHLAYDNENGKGYYCQLSTANETPLPDFIIKNSYIYHDELSDDEGWEDRIQKYNNDKDKGDLLNYKESLLRFDRVMGRLLDLKREYDSK